MRPFWRQNLQLKKYSIGTNKALFVGMKFDENGLISQ